MKKYIRKVHIDDKIWIWYIQRDTHESDFENVVIISPEKNRNVVSVSTFYIWKKNHDFTRCKGIGPGDIKEYIKDVIIP